MNKHDYYGQLHIRIHKTDWDNNKQICVEKYQKQS